MDYSIVIPVFNREDLTGMCLSTLLPTLEGAGTGEVIVVDNGSRQATADVLSAFPWVRVIRNATNLGFAAACNQGARAAAGRVICHLNNDIVAHRGWLATMLAQLTPEVGIVGARLLFPDGKIQHAGVAIYPTRFGPEGIGPHHLYWRWSGDARGADEPADFNIVTGACLLTPRDLFLELGGFDEIYWNGYEDVDYCLRVRDRGLRVVYEPRATLVHYESQSGVQRKRRLLHNTKTLSTRWANRFNPDHNRYWARVGMLRRESFLEGQRTMTNVPLPATTVIVHGAAAHDAAAFVRRLTADRIKPERIVWLAEGAVPLGTFAPKAGQTPLSVIRALFDERCDRYFAFVSTRTQLSDGWLDTLANEIEFGDEVMASTIVSDDSAVALEPCAADARCSLLNLRSLPRHIRFGEVDTVDGAVVDLTWQAVRHGLGVRAARVPDVVLGSPSEDPAFERRHGIAADVLRRPDIERMESALRDRPLGPTLTSIVMLSWNAPQYTQMAVESIRAHTRSPYEIILVDNGSEPETLAMLRALTDVRIIYNATNKGFAHGCNQGIAAAAGTHVVLLNNDVIVTAGWLENLLDAHRRDPLVGVSAPRSNRIVGHQQLPVVEYHSLDGMHEFAAGRSREFAGEHYRTQRAIGFCLCISRAVIDEVGGIDPRYGLGNFEDDDFCIRVRAAGYQIAVCEDVFIHHFGSVSFAANKVDYSSQMQRNWKIFAERWALPQTDPSQGYNADKAIARGFIPTRDYVALPALDTEPRVPAADRRSYATAFVALIDGEAAWSRVGPVVTNYIKSLTSDDPSLFAIGVTGGADAATIGSRIARSIDKLAVDELRVADIEVADVEIGALEEWVAAIPAATRLRVAKDDRLASLDFANDRSPSGLVRTVRGEKREAR